MGVSIRNKVGAGDLAGLQGIIEKVRALKEGAKDQIFMGTIVGMVHGLSYRSNPNGDEPSVGFKGVFEATPADPDMDSIQAPTLFLPGSVSKIFEETVLNGQPRPVTEAPKRGGGSIDIPTEQLPVLLELSMKKSTNAVGYEYVLNIHGDQKKVAVLDGLKAMLPKKLGGNDAKTLALPKADTKALPSPATATAPAKPAKRGKKK